MPDQQPQTTLTPGAAEIYRRAEALVPVLAARADACEGLRNCPRETMADFAAAGLLDLCKPARYGGAEHDWRVLCEVGRILARGDASQAWVCIVLNGHNQLLGAFKPAAQEEIWGAKRDARFAASVGPVGKARRAPGGAILSGSFPFASGIDYADWLVGGAMLEEESAPPAYHEFIISAASARIVDDWHAAGLAGSGSKSFLVDAVFVPAHRFQEHVHSEDGSGPGTRVNPAPVFRTPRTSVAVHCFSAIALGIAEAFLAGFLAHTRSRKTRGEGPNHASIAMEATRIEALAAYQAQCLSEWVTRINAGTPLAAHEKHRARFQAAWIARQVLESAQALFAGSGAHALLAASLLQRQVRDLMAVVAHRGLYLEEAAPAYAKSILARDER
jgi:alkylation response protein AidB-like acyl-CoA dehydrogenase